MPDIQMAPMAGHTSQGDTYIDTDGMVDAAGNRFSLLGQAQPGNGNDTFATLRKIAPNGVVVGEWTFRPSGNQKIDKANLLRSGQDVIVECITHAITSIKPRQLTKESGVVAGVFVTNPQFEAEEGGEGAWQPTGGQETEVDYDRINRMIRDAIGLIDGQTLKQEITGSPTGNFRQAIEDKNKDAIRELNLWSESLQHRGLNNFIKDRVYEVLVEGGLITPAEEPEA